MIALALLLQAAVAEPTPPSCDPGAYLDAAQPEARTRLTERMTDHRKISGMVGFMLLGGMTSLKVKTVLPGKAAAVRTALVRPRFLFCYEAQESSEGAADDGGMRYVGTSAQAMSPHEYRLVRFDIEGDQREVVLAANSVTGPKTGDIEKSTVRFEVREVAPGQYLVTPQKDLAPGEYGFLKTAGNITAANGKRAPAERVLDFAVE